MSNQEFIYWLGGFVSAVDKEGPTTKQWETIVSELNKVAEPVLFEGTGTTSVLNGVITNGNTTWTTLPKGTNVSYTANLPKELLND